MDVTAHYDRLIDLDNDPFRDPPELREYMDKWDGQAFLDAMSLSGSESVLEIGVGTGRLATRVIPLCGSFYGIDISEKTVDRAKENLPVDVSLICGDFLAYDFGRSFDVIYSSLTMMHFKDKHAFLAKVAAALNDAGRFVLSIDKNQSEYIDMGEHRLHVYPDEPAHIARCAKAARLTIERQFETEFAHVLVMRKSR